MIKIVEKLNPIPNPDRSNQTTAAIFLGVGHEVHILLKFVVLNGYSVY